MAEQSRGEIMRSERQRKRLVALVAGHVSSGIATLVGSGTEAANDRIATTAVDIAERILRKVGL
jgi:hypothetical protein